MKNVNPFKKVFIIAEVGVNHNGSLKLAFKLIDQAKMAGADAVKFQVFSAQELVSPDTALAKYQAKNLGPKVKNQFDLIRNLELSADDFKKLQAYCLKKKIKFLASPFDHSSVDLLNKLKVDMFKIPSGEITNLPLLQYLARTKKMLLLSTGMSTLKEVETAVRSIKAAGNHQLVVLHCVSEYPAPMMDLNLNAIGTLKHCLKLPIGFSDHSLGFEGTIAAVSLGACVIEKHMTLDKNMPGPDHKASLNPSEFKQMVSAIRNIEQAMGDGVKRPMKSELKNRALVRKSIFARNEILKGSMIKEKDLVIRRPANGLPPTELGKVVGRKVRQNIQPNQTITWKLLQ